MNEKPRKKAMERDVLKVLANVISVAVDVVTIPVSVAADVVTLGRAMDDRASEPYTVSKVKRIGKSLGSAVHELAK